MVGRLFTKNICMYAPARNARSESLALIQLCCLWSRIASRRARRTTSAEQATLTFSNSVNFVRARFLGHDSWAHGGGRKKKNRTRLKTENGAIIIWESFSQITDSAILNLAD